MATWLLVLWAFASGGAVGFLLCAVLVIAKQSDSAVDGSGQ